MATTRRAGRRMRTAGMVVALAVGAAGVTVAAAEPTAASSKLPVHYTVDASTTLAKLHQTVTVPPGTFRGSVDLSTGRLVGHLALPPATTTVGLAGIGLATATFQLAPVGRIHGSVDFATLTVTATASFNVLVTSVDPLGLPVNLVGNSCGTSTPVTVTFTGPFSLSGGSTFTGTYTIPPLQNCGAATAALDVVIPGPGNQFAATFVPAT